MSSLGLFLFTFFTLLVLSYCKRKANQTVPTYFARKDKNGKLIDASNISTWFRINTRVGSFGAESNQTSTVEVKPSIVKDGHYVIVSWSGIKNPVNREDFIALYCPENGKDNDYIDYFNVKDSPTYKEGKGEHSVQLTNLRTNCEFRYFKNISKDHQELAATSNTVMFEGGPEMPLQIHLALTGDPTQMRVVWVSGTGETDTTQQSHHIYD